MQLEAWFIESRCCWEKGGREQAEEIVGEEKGEGNRKRSRVIWEIGKRLAAIAKGNV